MTCKTCEYFLKNDSDPWGKCKLDEECNPDFVEEKEEGMCACSEYKELIGKHE